MEGKVNILLIGDTHFKNGIFGYLEAQINCISRIIIDEYYSENEITHVVFLGDVFDSRNPTATELLALRKLLDNIRECMLYDIFFLVGNHDRETKSQDSNTVLSLFDYGVNRIVSNVHTQGKLTFIPHYEDEKYIIENLEKVPEGNIIFGHFGFMGCVNSVGSYDFNIDTNRFNNDSYLGHIHRYSRNVTTDKRHKITVLGTPYTTSFSESGKESYYGILRFRNGEPEFERKLVTHGPTYIKCDIQELDKYEKEINDPNRFIILRVYVDKFIVDGNAEIANAINKKYPNIKYLEIKFKPSIDEKAQLSNYDGGILYSINEGIIDAYLEENTSNIPKDELLKGLEKLKNG